MNRRLIIFTLLTLFSSGISAISPTVWLTYGQSKFLYLPGIEAAFGLQKGFGIQSGLNFFIQSFNKDQLVRHTDKSCFNFYSASISLSKTIKSQNRHRFGGSAGAIVYYGPEYTFLHYYEEGGYPIYFDSSQLRPTFGIDLGVYYSWRKISVLLKYDTARNNLRFGIGYDF